MLNAPAVIGTKARTGGTKRAKNTASVPYLWKKFLLSSTRFGYFDIGQV